MNIYINSGALIFIFSPGLNDSHSHNHLLFKSLYTCGINYRMRVCEYSHFVRGLNDFHFSKNHSLCLNINCD